MYVLCQLAKRVLARAFLTQTGIRFQRLLFYYDLISAQPERSCHPRSWRAVFVGNCFFQEFRAHSRAKAAALEMQILGAKSEAPLLAVLLGDDSWAFSSSFCSRVGPELITSAASCYHKGWVLTSGAGWRTSHSVWRLF